VQIVDHDRIDADECRRQKIGLLLVIAFEANAITRFDNRLQQGDDVRRVQQLAGDAKASDCTIESALNRRSSRGRWKGRVRLSALRREGRGARKADRRVL
jgi:hypothetical protein